MNLRLRQDNQSADVVVGNTQSAVVLTTGFLHRFHDEENAQMDWEFDAQPNGLPFVDPAE